MKHLKETQVLQDISPKRIGIGAGIGLGLTIVAILFLSALISNGVIGASRMNLCAGGSVALGGLVAAFLSAGKRRKLITAALTAAVLLTMLFLLGFFFFTAAISLKNFAMILIILTISCMIGSIISGFVK